MRFPILTNGQSKVNYTEAAQTIRDNRRSFLNGNLHASDNIILDTFAQIYEISAVAGYSYD